MPDSKYREYFLGTLTEDGSAELELRVLEDEEFAAELAGVEEDLIEDFLDNSLSSEAARLFRTNYLNTEERAKNVEMTAMIRHLARQNADDIVKINDSDSSGHVDLIGWFTSLGLGVRLVAASLAFIIVMTSVWLVLRSQRDNELIALQTRYEQINQNPDSHGLDTKLSELTLVSGNVRASGPTAELSGTDLTENVRFRIALPPQTDFSTIYNVIIYRDSTEVFRQNNIRPLVSTAGAELRLLFPREIFTSGNYRLNLTSGNATELNYHFFVR